MPNLRVCLMQINACVGDLEGNRQRIARGIEQAKVSGAGLVIFPELAITGYPPEDLLLKDSFVTQNLKALRSLIPATAGLVAVVGFVDRDRKGRLYNAAAVLAGRRWAGTYHKAKLPNYGVFDEKRYFTEGSTGAAVEWGAVRLGISICEDIWQPEAMFYSRAYTDQISALVNISASPYHVGKQKTREALVRRLAVKSGAVIFYQNLVGGQDELVFDGGSMIAGVSGRIAARAVRFKEDLLLADVELPAKRWGRAKPGNLKIIKIPMPFPGPRSAGGIRQAISKPLPLEEEIYKALGLGLRDYVRKNGFEKVLVGLSGGIDSALVAAVAADALGPKDVVGVTLPSPFTSQATYQDAKKLAGNLGIELLEFRIDGIFSAYRAALETAFASHPQNVAEENLQSRIRGNLLMALSNKFGWLVLTTGNKSEMATGYCTLYGDTAGGFAVIKDVLKTQVYRLARYLNAAAGAERIPKSILAREPTAELRPGQKDRDTLPPYEVLDRFIECYVEKDQSVADAVGRRIPSALAQRCARMVDRNEYKRRQSPPGIKITPKAFGRDRRMPITNKFAS